MEECIHIIGARVNNLKNINLDIPLNKIVCFCGPSGSGKTSLAFHTLMSESKRRFLNSFPTYLKFFLDRPAPADVDSISPVLPVFSLPQVNPVVGGRSFVSDIMQVTEVLFNLYGAFSEEFCPRHKKPLIDIPFSSFLKKLDTKETYHLFILKDDFQKNYPEGPYPNRSASSQFDIHDFNKDDDYFELMRFKAHHLDKLDELVNSRVEVSEYLILTTNSLFQKIKYTKSKRCPECDYKAHKAHSVNHFNPLNALGACSHCNGFGATLEYDDTKLIDYKKTINEGALKILSYKRFQRSHDLFFKIIKDFGYSFDTAIENFDFTFFDLLFNGYEKYPGILALLKFLETKKYKPGVRIFLRGIQKETKCEVCDGSRINKKFHSYYLKKNLPSYKDIWSLTIEELLSQINSLDFTKIEKEEMKLIGKLKSLSKLAIDIGLGGLNLNQKTKLISAGEYQRLLMIKYLSYEGTGSLFIFDEPSLGLNQEECELLFKALIKLKEAENTVILIDHSRILQKLSDEIIVMGEGAGHLGGEVIYQGKFKTSPLNIKVDTNILPLKLEEEKWIKILHFQNKNLKDFKLLEGGINLIQGSSLKSYCIKNILAPFFSLELKERENFDLMKASGGEEIRDALIINSDLNRFTSRSTVGSLTELFSVVRKHFLKTPFAKSMGLKEGHLSSNSKLGACSSCDGRGFKVIEMQFLEDIIIECEDCKGKKIKPLYANISDGRMTLTEAFNKPISEVFTHIDLTPKFKRVLQYMEILNLSYLSLDRSINSLSGGERQRLYFLSKIIKKIENTFLVLENISFGLSERELYKLMEFLKKIATFNNTIVVIDSHPDFHLVANHQVSFN